jgi:hypothetical protein
VARLGLALEAKMAEIQEQKWQSATVRVYALQASKEILRDRIGNGTSGGRNCMPGSSLQFKSGNDGGYPV